MATQKPIASSLVQKPLIVLVAGGTGGHFFPALALNEALKVAGYPTHVITDERTHFPESLSAQTPVLRMELSRLNGLKGHILFAMKGLWQSLKLWRWMRQSRVGLVIGFGGYVSAPVLLAGALSGIPLMLHEQNAYVGRVARLFAPWVTRITTGFMPIHGLASRWQNKCVLTGNPVRPAFTEVSWHPQGSGITLVVLGGSQGARVMGRMVAPAVAQLPESVRQKLTVYHQARPEDREAVIALYKSAGIEAQVQSFFDNIPHLLAQADLVICRAGAATLSELMCVGTPALLIPYPHAMDDHQTYNARALADHGAVFVAKESNLDENQLAKTIEHVIKNAEQRQCMARQMKALGQSDAVTQMVKVIESLSSKLS